MASSVSSRRQTTEVFSNVFSFTVDSKSGEWVVVITCIPPPSPSLIRASFGPGKGEISFLADLPIPGPQRPLGGLSALGWASRYPSPSGIVRRRKLLVFHRFV